jgi:hypothetical protein
VSACGSPQISETKHQALPHLDRPALSCSTQSERLTFTVATLTIATSTVAPVYEGTPRVCTAQVCTARGEGQLVRTFAATQRGPARRTVAHPTVAQPGASAETRSCGLPYRDAVLGVAAGVTALSIQAS